ncbi:hypothetical protein MRX96_024965 [Rhipicephalus microplus]
MGGLAGFLGGRRAFGRCGLQFQQCFRKNEIHPGLSVSVRKKRGWHEREGQSGRVCTGPFFLRHNVRRRHHGNRGHWSGVSAAIKATTPEEKADGANQRCPASSAVLLRRESSPR